MPAAPPTQTDLKSALEEMRAPVAGQGAGTGLVGMVQDALLKIVEVLIAAEGFSGWQTGPPVAMDAGADAGAAPAEDEAAVAGVAPGVATPAGWRGWWRAAWLRRPEWVATGWVPAFAGMPADSVTCPGTTGKDGEYGALSDGSARSGRQAGMRPPGARQSENDGGHRGEVVDDGVLHEVRGAQAVGERGASAARRRGIVLTGTPARPVAGTWRNTRGGRRALPPCGRGGEGLRGGIFEKRVLARGERREKIVTISVRACRLRILEHDAFRLGHSLSF
jgi:hypothetical protein